MCRPTTFLAVATLLTLSVGCGRSPPKPAEVYRSFHEGLASMARGGETGGARAAYALLTKESQEHLVKLADALNDRLPASVPRLEPADLLRVRRLLVGAPLDDVVETSVSEEVALLEVRSGETVQKVTLKREGTAWRVAYFETPETAGASKQGEP